MPLVSLVVFGCVRRCADGQSGLLSGGIVGNEIAAFRLELRVFFDILISNHLKRPVSWRVAWHGGVARVCTFGRCVSAIAVLLRGLSTLLL